MRLIATVALVVACDRSSATKSPVDADRSHPIPPAISLRHDEMIGPFDSWLDVTHPERLGLDVRAAKGDGTTDDTEALQAAIDAIGVPYGGGEIPPSQCVPEGLTDGCALVPTTPNESFLKGRSAAACAKGGKHPVCLKGLPGQPRNLTRPVATVLYLPAGHYKISHTLKFYNRQGGLMIIGESPESTSIEWAGAAWTSGHEPPTDNDADTDMLLLDGGQTWFSLRRIAFDGRGAARVGINFGSTSQRGGGGGETMQLTDLRLRNLGFGMFVGGPNGANDADSSVRRTWFQNISKAAFTVLHYNTLNWIVSDSLFERCDRAVVKNEGSVILYDDLFIDNNLDVEMRTIHSWAMRGNVSVRALDYPRTPVTGMMTSAFYRISENFAFVGNLTVDPGAKVDGPPQVGYWRQGPAYFVDNDFFLSEAACAASGKVNTTIKLGAATPPDWQKGEPVAGGRLPEPLERDYVLAGNRCNGALVTPNVGLGTARTLVPKTELPRAEAYPLGLTPADIASLRTRTMADGAARDALHARLPVTPKRIDPHDKATVFLADVPAAMAAHLDPVGMRVLDTFLKNAMTDARLPENLNKVHVLHFPHGTFNLDTTLEVPGDLAFSLLGDGIQLTRVTAATPVDAPVLAVRGQVAKLTAQDFGIYAGHLPTGAATKHALFEVESADARGGRAFNEDGMAKGRSAGVEIQGFDRLVGVMDSTQIVGLHVEGGDTGVSAGAQMYGITAGAAPGVSPLHVSHKGRLVARDMYSESQIRGMDLTGGSGTFVLDNVTKMQIPASAPVETEMLRVGDFEGDAYFFNLLMERPLSLGAPVLHAQSVTILGGDLYAGNGEVRPRLATFGPVATWSFNSVISCDGLLGLQAASTTPALHLVALNFMMDGLFQDVAHNWQNFTRNCQNVSANLDAAGIDAQLARAFVELQYRARPRSIPNDDLQASDVAIRRVELDSDLAFGLLVRRVSE